MLRKKGSLDAVEREYGIDYECDSTTKIQSSAPQDILHKDNNIGENIVNLCSKLLDKSGVKALLMLLETIIFALLGTDDILEMMDNIFLNVAKRKEITSNPSHFISLSVLAMENLQNHKKINLLFKFAECVGKQRPDGSDTLMPMNRMPFGLLEYQIQFFTCTNTQQVREVHHNDHR